MSTETVSAVTAITKIQYSHPVCRWIVGDANARMARIKKIEDWVGGPGASNTGTGSYVVPMQIESQQPGGVSVPIAQAGLAPSKFQAFTMNRVSDYGVARVALEVIEALSTNNGAFLNVFKREMDSALFTVKRSQCIHQFRAGTGSRGQIAATANVASSVIQLANPPDALNFALNLPIQAVNGDGGTLRSAGANATITKIDRISGILTFGDVLTNYIAAAAANDYLIRSGDLNGVITGMSGWNPKTAVSGGDSFFGVNRSIDTRLTGGNVNGTGFTIRETGIAAMTQVKVQGGDPDTWWMNPVQLGVLARECEGKSLGFKEVTANVKVEGSKFPISFDTYEVMLDGSKVTVISDFNCPGGESFVTQEDTWSHVSLGPVPHVLTAPGAPQYLIVANDDSLEMRFVARGNVANDGPAYSTHVYGMASS